MDRIDQERVDREARERARLHPGREPSEPPRSEKGFRSGIDHLGHGAGQLTKRVVVLIGIWGLISTPLSAGFAYWFANANDRRDNAQAKRDAEMRELLAAMGRTSDRIELTTSGLGPHLEKTDAKVDVHSNAIAHIEGWAKTKGMK